jgi:hypothetical protein
VPEMTAADVWPAIMRDEVHGMAVRQALAFLMMVPPEAFAEAINRIGRETSLGPLLDPTAYLDGRRFDNATDYAAVLNAAAKLRAELGRAADRARGGGR